MQPAPVAEEETTRGSSSNADILAYIAAVWAVALLGGFLPMILARRKHQKIVSSAPVAVVGEGERERERERPAFTNTHQHHHHHHHHHHHDEEEEENDQSLLSLLNVFSGGVFISAGYMHLLPDAMEELEELSYRTGFSWAPFFSSCGFMMVFLFEEFFEALVERFFGMELVDGLPHSPRSITRHSHCHTGCGAAFEEAPLLKDVPAMKGDDSVCSSIHTMGGDTFSSSCPVDIRRHSSHVDMRHEPAKLSANSVGMGLVLGSALGFHSIMEGLGLGSSTDGTVGVFAAIALHKGLAAFSLGSILFRSGFGARLYASFMLVFSMLSPIGALIGMALRNMGAEPGGIGAGICSALASGTFIHVAAIEVLPRELMNCREQRLFKLGLLMVGYSIMTILSIWV